MINFDGKIGSFLERLTTTQGVIVTGNIIKLLRGTRLFFSVILTSKDPI